MGKPRKPKGAKSSSGLDAGTLVVGAVLVLGVALAAYLMTGSSPSQPAAPAATAAKKQPSTEIFAEAFELYQKQEWKAAASSFRKYLRLQPTDTSALNNLGLSLTYSGDLDEAIKTLNKIGVDAPNHADAMSNLGIAYNKNRQAEEAIQAYRKALLANPALQQEKRYQEAADVMVSVLEQEFEAGGSGQDFGKSRAMLKTVKENAKKDGVRLEVREMGSMMVGEIAPTPVPEGQDDSVES